MIEVRDVEHRYTGAEAPAISGLSFEIPEGKIFGFLGPSGAGKSTTQNLMTGLLPVRHGTIAYDGTPVGTLGHRFFNRIGVSFEHPNVYPKLTGLENLRYFAGLFDVPTEDPMKILDLVGLTDAAHKRASAYSKGMKQRLVFARSILNKPRILFLDEPTSGLDPSTADRIKNIILEKRAGGTTVFLTTHNMQIADDLCDTVAFLNDGRIVAMDSPRALKLAYGEASVAVEFRDAQGTLCSEILFPAKDEDRARLKAIFDGFTVETVHSREASLEQIFIRLTGRMLS